ncbi:hypothetical protein [Sphaerisporangium sp. NPDC051011]|uniref:hypothetical protein n=1 Tax=Sphaerisporangium sp. NPDC051011 TaxID=3155792 RepID=UPI0033D19A76
MATNQPGYYVELEAVKNGTARTVPIETVIPDWILHDLGHRATVGDQDPVLTHTAAPTAHRA